MGGYAWVTLATNNSYSLGALVLAHSLKKAKTAHKLAVLITPAVSESMRDQLRTVFDLVKVVDVLDSKDEAHLGLLKRPDLGITFTKIHCWRLTEFEKCVFLDADTLVVRNCDELFEKEEFSAAPDVSWPDCFNSGVFVYRPSVETFNKILQFAVENRSFDGGDQGLLNQYFSDWATEDIKKHLPFVYNLTTVAAYSYVPAFKHYGSETRIVHFIGTGKPWLQQLDVKTRTVTPTSGSEHLTPMLQQWWDLFCEKVQPNLDKNLESNNDGMSHPPVEANSLPVALTDESETVRLVEPPVTYREKDDFRQCNLPYQPFDVKGPSGELLNLEFLLASIVPPEETVKRSDEQRRQDCVEEKQNDGDKIERGDSKDLPQAEDSGEPEKAEEEQKVKKENQQQQQQQQQQLNKQSQQQQQHQKESKQQQQQQLQQSQQQQQEEPPPPPPPDPFEYNSFFPDETCISNYLEKNVVTYQPFENHQNNVGEENPPLLPRFLTIPQDDQRQSGNIETQQQEEHDKPMAHPHKETTPPRIEREKSPPKEGIQVRPAVEMQELSKSKSMSSFPCDVKTPPKLSIWKSQPDVSVDPNRKYSMPKLKPILPKQRSFSKSIPSAFPKVTMYTEVLLSSDYKDPDNLPGDKIGFVETHIRREAKLKRSKSDADVRDRFGPLPYCLSPEVKEPVVPKRIPLRLLDNDFYDLTKCKRQMGNKPKPKDSETRREKVCSMPALKPIVPAKDKKSTLIKKRTSKELSPDDGGRGKMAKREPKSVRERKRNSINIPRNVSTNGNGNNLDEVLQRLREYSKNYQHFFGVAVKPVTVKNSTVQDENESRTSGFDSSGRTRESRASKKEADAVEFRQFRNYVKDRRETSQKGLLNIQDILSDSKEGAVNSTSEGETPKHSRTGGDEVEPIAVGAALHSKNSSAVLEESISVKTVKRSPLKRQTKISDPADDIPSLTESTSNNASENSSHSVILTQEFETNCRNCKSEKTVSERLRKQKKPQTNCTDSEKKSQQSKTSPEFSCCSPFTQEKQTAVAESEKVDEAPRRIGQSNGLVPAVLSTAGLKSRELPARNVDNKHNSKVSDPVVWSDELDRLALTTEKKEVENSWGKSTENVVMLKKSKKSQEDPKDSSARPAETGVIVEPVAKSKTMGYLASPALRENSVTAKKQKENVESRFGRNVTNDDVIAAEERVEYVKNREREAVGDDVIGTQKQKNVGSKDQREAAADVVTAAEKQESTKSKVKKKGAPGDVVAAEDKEKIKRNAVGDDVTAANSSSNTGDDKNATAPSPVTFSQAQGRTIENGVKTPVQNGTITTAVEKQKKKTDAGQQKTARKASKILLEFDTPRTSRVTPPNPPCPLKEKTSTAKPRATTPRMTHPAPRKNRTFEDGDTPSGIAGAIAQLNLEEGSEKIPESAAMSTAHQEYLRRQNWETGNVDYMGRDSFDNIWSKICETIEGKESEEKARERAKQQSEEPPKTTTPQEKPVSLSTILQKCPEYMETLPGEPTAGPVEDDEIIFSKPENKQTNLTNIVEEEEAGTEGCAAARAGNVKLSDILQPAGASSTPVKPQPVAAPTEAKSQATAPAEMKAQSTPSEISETKLQPTAAPAEIKPYPAAAFSVVESQPTETKLQPTPAFSESKLSEPKLHPVSSEIKPEPISATPLEAKPQLATVSTEENSKPVSAPAELKSQPTVAPTEIKLQPTEQKSPPAMAPTVPKSQLAEEKFSSTAAPAGNTPHPIISPPEIKPQSAEEKSLPATAPAEPKPHFTAAISAPKSQSTEQNSQPVAAPAQIKPEPAVTPLETKAETKESATEPQTPDKTAGKECTTVAIPSPPITFPGAPPTEKDKQQTKTKKPEEKPQVVSEPIPLPPPDAPTTAPTEMTEIKTSRSDSLKDDGKQKKGVFTKILEMVGVAPKEKNGEDSTKSVFYDVEEPNQTKQAAEEETKGGEEGEAKQSQPVEKGEEAREVMNLESTKTEEEKAPTEETKPGQSPFPKPARSSSPREQTDSIQPSPAGKSPSPKLKIPQMPPETEVTTPTPPPQPDVSPRKNSALLKVDDTILETPPVTEPTEESGEEIATGKAKSEVESVPQDAGESSDLIDTMNPMMGESEEQEGSPPETVEELKVTSKEERKRHKGEAVTSKLSDQILKAIPPPRRKAISDAAASTSAIPKGTAGQEQKTPAGEGKGKSSKTSSIPVPPPRNRGKPTPPAPSKGKGKK